MELLVCPICKGPLTREAQAHELVCAADRLAFPIRDGIAVMLETEARPLDAAQASTAGAGHDNSRDGDTPA